MIRSHGGVEYLHSSKWPGMVAVPKIHNCHQESHIPMGLTFPSSPTSPETFQGSITCSLTFGWSSWIGTGAGVSWVSISVTVTDRTSDEPWRAPIKICGSPTAQMIDLNWTYLSGNLVLSMERWKRGWWEKWNCPGAMTCSFCANDKHLTITCGRHLNSHDGLNGKIWTRGLEEGENNQK